MLQHAHVVWGSVGTGQVMLATTGHTAHPLYNPPTTSSIFTMYYSPFLLNQFLSEQTDSFMNINESISDTNMMTSANRSVLTLYTSTSLACGKWKGAMNKRTHSLFTPSRYRLSATIRATKFLPVPDQPWKERVRGLLESGFSMKPCTAFRTTAWAKCCP